MALKRPFVTSTFISYEGDSIDTTVSMAVRLTDGFTGENIIKDIRLFLKEQKDQRPIRNSSGYFCFTDLPDQKYMLVIEPNPIRADWYLLPSDREDGKGVRSLEREISVPIDELFEFKNSTKLAVRLKNVDAKDIVSQFLKRSFSAGTLQALNEYDENSGPPSEVLQNALIPELNQLLKGPSLYQEDRFAQVTLSAEIQELIERNPQGEELIHLNRLLLADAYPQEIGKSQETPVVKITLPPKPSYPFPSNATLVRGRVVRSQGGKVQPIAGAVVRGELYDPNDVGPPAIDETPAKVRTQTDREGYYVLFFKSMLKKQKRKDKEIKARVETQVEGGKKARDEDIIEGETLKNIDFNYST